VKMDVGMLGQPGVALLVRAVIVQRGSHQLHPM
jgi:hypothetical protein